MMVTVPAVRGPYPVPDVADLGPAMQELTPKRRAFVCALLETGGQRPTDAARLAGIGGKHPHAATSYAWKLMRCTDVIAAIKEEAARRIHSTGILAASALMEIAQDPYHKDRFKAADRLLDRSGFIVTTKHEVEVKDTRTREELLAIITEGMKRLGPDAAKLIAAPTVDAEFEVVGSSEGLEDLL